MTILAVSGRVAHSKLALSEVERARFWLEWELRAFESNSSRTRASGDFYFSTQRKSRCVSRPNPKSTGAQRGPHRSALSSAVNLAVAGVGKRSQDGAGALMDHLTHVHGEGENNDEKEEIDAKQRMQ